MAGGDLTQDATTFLSRAYLAQSCFLLSNTTGKPRPKCRRREHMYVMQMMQMPTEHSVDHDGPRSGQPELGVIIQIPWASSCLRTIIGPSVYESRPLSLPTFVSVPDGLPGPIREEDSARSQQQQSR